jgi:hypothetical protein
MISKKFCSVKRDPHSSFNHERFSARSADTREKVLLRDESFIVILDGLFLFLILFVHINTLSAFI